MASVGIGNAKDVRNSRVLDFTLTSTVRPSSPSPLLSAKTTFTLAISLAATFAAAATEPHESGGLEHIVIFNNDQPIPAEIDEVLTRLELTADHPDVRHVFKNSAFRGFAASMKSHCLDLLANMTDVSIVERTASVQSAYAIPKQRRAAGTTIDTRGHAPWGLNRISTAAFAAGDAREMEYTKDRCVAAGLGDDDFCLYGPVPGSVVEREGPVV
jgi:hypothetical protein